MKGVFIFIFLLQHVICGELKIECAATSEKNLVCKFPDNVNSTQKDFGVYFYPHDGGEEPLVDCGWVKSQLHCIRQEGFECKNPVNNTAVITIPTEFSNRNGSYKCVTDGYKHDSIRPCQLSKKQDMSHFALCDANATVEHTVVIKCRFSFNVSNFSIVNNNKNNNIVHNFSKTFCETSNKCSYKIEDSVNIFTVEVETENNPGYDEYRCLPNVIFPRHEVKSCSAKMETETQSSSVPVNVTIIYIVVSVTTGMVLVIVIFWIVRASFKRRMEGNRQNRHKENELILMGTD
ncbi:uncharacterized protein LOC112568034 isoform X1 [Pomacea canaliculata]|uniref:uncharacterized protein LOC112568034 isoform X1 n=1 Tax=Pomacea canaliculata TaxID=400727 RepID=UPI000D7349C6|nr:uncharacterized protein LOC112568034 isoform X1 [Pomacea canaliculata]